MPDRSSVAAVFESGRHGAVNDMPETAAGEDAKAREVRRALEALLMVTEEPLAMTLAAQLLEISADHAEDLCRELAAEYDATDRGFQLVRIAGGWRFQTHPDAAPYIERFVLDGQSGRLSNAALETLAIVAYKQPISRAQVSAIRGVNVDGVMRTLAQRGYIDEVARDPGPGQAVLYGTTAVFLEKLGLEELEQLPALGEFVPGTDVFEALERGLRPHDDAIVDGGLPVDGAVSEDDDRDVPGGEVPDPVSGDPASDGPASDDPIPDGPASDDVSDERTSEVGAHDDGAAPDATASPAGTDEHDGDR